MTLSNTTARDRESRFGPVPPCATKPLWARRSRTTSNPQYAKSFPSSPTISNFQSTILLPSPKSLSNSPQNPAQDERRRSRRTARLHHRRHQWPRALQPRGRWYARELPPGAVRPEVCRLQCEPDAVEAVSGLDVAKCGLSCLVYYTRIALVCFTCSAILYPIYMMTVFVNVSYYLRLGLNSPFT